MKKKLFYVCIIANCYFANAQVGIGTPNPINSTLLDIDSKDKGVLVPRIDLTDHSSFAPITGDQVQGLLVYNDGSKLDKGFYYWKDKKWNLIVDQSNLEQTINAIISQDIGEVKNIVDFLVPSNPKSSDNSLDQAALVIDPTTKKIYSVTYDLPSKKYIKSDIELDKLVVEHETKTLLKKAIVEQDDQLDFQGTSAPKNSKKGEVYYQYLAENGHIDYLNITQDLNIIFENNQAIRNQLIGIIAQNSGNVYYTEIAIEHIPKNSLYQVDPITKEKKLIDIDQNITEYINKNTQIIKQKLGNKIIYNTIISTGNQIEGDDIYLFKGNTTISEKGAKTQGLNIGELPDGKTKIDRIISTTIFKNKTVFSTSITDVVITNSNIAFNIGQGIIYYPLDKGVYEIVIEFTMK